MDNLYNDYAQHFVDTGARPQNFITDGDWQERFQEYPKLQTLVRRKDEWVRQHASAPMALKADLKTFDLTTLGRHFFDVIVLDPPWLEYSQRAPNHVQPKCGGDPYWTMEQIAKLPIPDIAASPSFIFLWVGDSRGLDEGRQLLVKWGYRRCEDIVWIKTNKRSNSSEGDATTLRSPRAVLQQTKEHCLMGIRGTARRSTDSHFIHCNIDTDVIVAEEPPVGSTAKPEELLHIIEHFCLGQRRLYLFGEDNNIRPGWVTVGLGLSESNFDAKQYRSAFQLPAGHLLPPDATIDALRPKSPPPRDKPPSRAAGNGRALHRTFPHRGPGDSTGMGGYQRPMAAMGRGHTPASRSFPSYRPHYHQYPQHHHYHHQNARPGMTNSQFRPTVHQPVSHSFAPNPSHGLHPSYPTSHHQSASNSTDYAGYPVRHSGMGGGGPGASTVHPHFMGPSTSFGHFSSNTSMNRNIGYGGMPMTGVVGPGSYSSGMGTQTLAPVLNHAAYPPAMMSPYVGYSNQPIPGPRSGRWIDNGGGGPPTGYHYGTAVAFPYGPPLGAPETAGGEQHLGQPSPGFHTYPEAVGAATNPSYSYHPQSPHPMQQASNPRPPPT
ncbi:N6-adenosine-methyltransferase subunit mettl14 [Dispira parvispora]|uniref:N6-adenosine-methyltransferase subunit mettl14 n=1 Tax=Dispira parvispora TaxID=1520584 RepID=A0A9W8APE0_9FUNG|nr:N6-adenosine-methyltransferase subunit mettl14 [Dispira parvispora]